MSEYMEIPPRASVLRVCVIATLCVALRISAQQQASPPAAAVPQAELQPLIIDDGRHQGEVALTIDLDSNGSVANATASSGGDLVPIAIAGTKIFRYANHGSASGLTQQVLFVRGKDVKSVAPIYPPIAKAAHVTGTVRMVATVAADGHVTDVTVLSGPPMLQGSAKDSLFQWIFPPVQRSGAPSPSHAIVDIHFAQQW
jgi:TonB family protein